MELISGYKQTKAGMIPEDWEAKLLPELCWFQEGPGLRQWQFRTSGMKVINITNLENGILNLDRTVRYISMDEFMLMYQHFSIDSGDIVMASSGNSYSKAAIVRDQDLPLVMNTSVIRFKPTKETDFRFLWTLLNSLLFKDQIDLMITGGAQPNFGPFHLKQVVVPHPPLPEQRAISAALSDVDTLIASLDRMIAKQRDMKQAVMQELLTGKRRLPGFSGEWVMKRLGEVAPLQRGYDLPSSQLKEGPYPVVYSNGIVNSHHLFMVSGPGVVTGRSGTIGKVTYVEDDFWPHNTSLWVTDFKGNEPKFIYYLFLFIKLDRFSTGSGVPTLNRNDVHDFHIRIPSKPEQTVIASILSDIDADIAALEQKLNKTRMLKQGMMQELLTGRIRLV